MKHTWSTMKPNDYDAHMAHPNVAQIQKLNAIIKEQFLLLDDSFKQKYVAILGITNGNGLEHVIDCNIDKVIGIDINPEFLQQCRVRYPRMLDNLQLYQLDLIHEASEVCKKITSCHLILANLLIKHIHLHNFINCIKNLPHEHRIVSCVIQSSRR